MNTAMTHDGIAGKHDLHAVTVIVPATVDYELEDKMSVYITREMLRHAAYEDKHDETIGLLGRLGRSLNRWWHRRWTIAQLESMDDTLLRDIGIKRCEIRRVVNGLSDCDMGLSRSARTPQ